MGWSKEREKEVNDRIREREEALRTFEWTKEDREAVDKFLEDNGETGQTDEEVAVMLRKLKRDEAIRKENVRKNTEIFEKAKEYDRLEAIKKEKEEKRRSRQIAPPDVFASVLQALRLNKKWK